MNCESSCRIFKEPKCNEIALKEPIYIYDYHPYYSGTNPEWDTNSGLILDVKQNLPKGINHFTNILKSKLSNNEYVICIIPTHEEGTKPSGIRSIAKRLCIPPVIDGTEVLYRVKETQKKTSGGCRDFTLEIESLKVRYKNLIMGKQVLLLDDVTTTGTSLDAGKMLLEESGAGLVVRLALGKTC